MHGNVNEPVSSTQITEIIHVCSSSVAGDGALAVYFSKSSFISCLWDLVSCTSLFIFAKRIKNKVRAVEDAHSLQQETVLYVIKCLYQPAYTIN